MKTKLIDIDKRINSRPNKVAGILTYDEDNAYPQRVRWVANNSSTTKSCIKTFAKYVRGMGFEEQTFYGAVCNRKGWTFDRILRNITNDYAMYAGFALHFNFNALKQIVEINFVPFENVRICLPDDSGHIAKVQLHNDWAAVRGRFEKDKVVTINVFNPKPEIVEAQIVEAGGIEKYKGQVLYYTGDAEDYPLCTFDAVFEDAETEGEIKHYKNRQVTTSFMSNNIFVNMGRFETDSDEETEFYENLKKFQGARQSGKLFVVEAEDENQVPKIIPIENNIDDKLFEYTENSIRENIIRNSQTPPILLGVATAGALGEKQDREGAKNVYSEVTEDDRILIQSIFKNIFPYWYNQDHNPSGNFKILPIVGVSKTVDPTLLQDMTQNERRTNLLNLPPVAETTSAKNLLVSTFGVGGTQAFKEILVDAVLTSEQKRNTLIIVFGFTKDQAALLVPDSLTVPETTT